MKKMTCQQLGGACEKEFSANSFEEIAQMSQKHGTEMYQKGDAAHLKAMIQMQDLMQSPERMNIWFEAKRKEFKNLPESK